MKKLSSKKWFRSVATFLFLLLGAVFLTWLIEYHNWLKDGYNGLHYMLRPVGYYTIMLVFFMELIVYAIVGRLFTSIGVASSLVLIIGYIHNVKYQLRGSPLLPADFKLAGEVGEVASFVDVWSIIRLIIAIILTMKLAFMAQKAWKKLAQRTKETGREWPWWRREHIIPRILLIGAAVFAFSVSTSFIKNRSGEKTETTFLGTEFVTWNQMNNYWSNGFVVAFLYNAYELNLNEPENYDKENIENIVAELSEKVDSKRSDLADTDYNIVLILNESFYDPSIIAETYPYSGGDVTPVWHKIQQQYPSGFMYSPDYGGGTANIEYEVVTGLTNFWTNTVPYTNLVARKQQMDSIARFTRDNDYQAFALHPFTGSFYRRDESLKVLGFEEFMTQADFSFTETNQNNAYIHDGSAYRETLKQLSERDGKQLIHLITMQNHLPYNTIEDTQFKLTGEIEDNEKAQIETYMETVHRSDAYLGEFLAALDKFNEKTVVLFYGDHSPGVFPKVANSEDIETRNKSRLTPYFIYANFELPGQKNVLGNSLMLPTTTPNCLTNTMFNVLDAEKPLIGYLLDEVCAEQPILTSLYFDDEPEMTETLKNYQLLTYDMAVGKQYSLGKI